MIILALGLIYIFYLFLKYKAYKNSSYYKITRNSYFVTRSDLGKYGEYLIYKHLRDFEKKGCKFLFNIYVPKGKTGTSEIDVLLITPKGLFVFESKNYSGWIFGNEYRRNWVQILPKGYGQSYKERFYNPIMQNETHIRYLKRLIGKELPIRSVIVFSERCTLKEITVHSQNTAVIQRNDVHFVVSKMLHEISSDYLSTEEINTLYEKLYPYTQVIDEVKAQHIKNIRG